jgi:hypothetical protein
MLCIKALVVSNPSQVQYAAGTADYKPVLAVKRQCRRSQSVYNQSVSCFKPPVLLSDYNSMDI